MVLTNDKLYKNEYEMETLIENIEYLNLNVILTTQKLTIPFCVKYIMNSRYQTEQDEKDITLSDIIEKQPNLKKTELIQYLVNPDNKIFN